MKKFISKLKKHLRNNQGSSLVLVIVALAFIGILMGALLTASMAVYRLKLYDYNARDNFYYVEQAMNEIYAGVSSKTVEYMQTAYNDTLEELIKFDAVSGTYTTIDNDEANELFQKKFMEYIKGDALFKKDQNAALLASFISNPDVDLMEDRLDMSYYTESGPIKATEIDGKLLDRVVIKSVTVSRSVDYNRSQASGKFTQTISSDIEIWKPDFKVDFQKTAPPSNNLFNFCVVADSGIEFNETPGSKIDVTGDIYAASDYYNKRYNQYEDSYAASSDPYSVAVLRSSYKTDPINYSLEDGSVVTAAPAPVTDGGEEEKKATYQVQMNPVSSVAIAGESTNNLYNHNDYKREVSKDIDNYKYDGKNEHSAYSGVYIDNNRVNIVASQIIVPGTIAVMNTAQLSVFGDSRNNSSYTSIWADNMVLGGYTNSVTKAGSSALLNANVFMRDDTSIEGDGATYKLVGSYYGYSDGTKADVREFVPTVAKDENGQPIYQEYKEENNRTLAYTKGHYNSSAFIVNGERANIDLSNAKNIYLAGRSYIEVSRQTTKSELKEEQPINVKTRDNNGNLVLKEEKFDVTDESYQYDPDIKDYKTGESLAVSSGQFAYLPYDTPKQVIEKDEQGNDEIHYESKLPVDLQNAQLFVKYFGSKDPDPEKHICQYVPVTYQTKEVEMADGSKRTKGYYYLDFEYAVKHNLYDKKEFNYQTDNNLNMADLLSKSFIRDYYYYLNFSEPFLMGDLSDSLEVVEIKEGETVVTRHANLMYKGTKYYDVDTSVLSKPGLSEILRQIHDDEAFEAGEIKLPEDSSSVYASGTLASSIVTTTNENNTTKKDIVYNVTVGNETIQSTLKTDVTKDENGEDKYESSKNTTDGATNARAFSREYAQHYNYVKWMLGDVPQNDPHAKFVDGTLINTSTNSAGEDIVSGIYGEASLTPLNYYLNMNYINENTNIDMTVGSGYRVIVSGGDVRLNTKEDEMTGIIIAAGDVYFGDPVDSDVDGLSNSRQTVSQFNGIVISGGKVYFNGDLTKISASVYCEKIMTLLYDQYKNGEGKNKTNAETVIKIFKAYKTLIPETEEGGGNVNVDTVYKDIANVADEEIVKYNNWMKSVE